MVGGSVFGFRKKVSRSLEIIIIFIFDKEVIILVYKWVIEEIRSVFFSNKIKIRRLESLVWKGKKKNSSC